MIYVNVGGIRDPLKQDLALVFCRNQNKDIRILADTHINHDQMHHILFYILSFSVLEIVKQKDCFSYLIRVLTLI